jgi:hypothetical protein
MSTGRGKSRLRVFAASLTLVAAMAIGAFAASGAQALTWHNWGTTVLSGAESETVASSEGTINISGTLLGSQVQLGCTTTGTGSIAGAGGSSTINLVKCSVSKPANCSLASPVPLRASVSLVQLGGGLFQKFTPAAGSNFGTIEFAGRLCPLAEDTGSLKGSFAGREITSGLAVNRSLSLTKGEGEEWPGVALTINGQTATITGDLSQHLSGLLEGVKWQGTAAGWKVETGSAFAQSERVEVLGGPVKFSTTFFGSAVSFTCGKVSGKEPSLIPGGSESINGLTFSGCSVEQPANCSLPNGEMTFGAVTGTLMGVNGKAYERFTPVKSAFSYLEFVGAKCPLAENTWALKGSFAALGPEFGVLKNYHSLEFSDAANSATGSELTTNAAAWHVSGSLLQELRNETPWDVFL